MLAAAEEGINLVRAGEFEAGIERLKEAQQLHGEPSAVLENWIGLAYDGLGLYALSIVHYSNALAVRDSALDRVNRATAYWKSGQCELAIEDAQTALTMEPQGAPGHHTDVGANVVLTSCHYENGDFNAALQHLDAAIALAKEHSYSAEYVAILSQDREALLGN